MREVMVDDDYLHWLNDPEITRWLETYWIPMPREKMVSYIESKLGSMDEVFLAIIRRDVKDEWTQERHDDHRVLRHYGDKHIGNIKLGPINWQHRTADIGILIGDKAEWGKGYATEAIKLIVDYAFIRLGLHKVTASAYADNIGSIKAFEKAGFVVEGTRKEQFYREGKRRDCVMMGLIRPESPTVEVKTT